jgi:hypothetical protein
MSMTNKTNLMQTPSDGGAHFTDVVNWLSKFKKAPGS